MNFDLIIVTLIVGGLVLLSFLKLTNSIEVNKKANTYFGLFLLLFSTFWLDEMILPNGEDINNGLVSVIKFIQFFTPIAFFLSIKYYTNPYFKYSGKDFRYLFMPIVFLLLLLFKAYINPQAFKLIYIILFLGHSILYTLLAYLKIRKHQRDIESFSSSTESIDLRWIKYIIYSFISAAVIITIYNIYSTSETLNIYINLYFLTVVYFVAFYSLRQKEIYPKGLHPEETLVFEDNSDDLQKNKLLNDEELLKIKEQLLLLMANEKPYLDGDLNLLKLSEKLNISSHQLSYVVNTGLGENFFQFVNKYRVQRAKELLTDPQYDHLNMLAIGYEAGFNSKTSFNTIFKKMTEYTPSEYKRNRPDL